MEISASELDLLCKRISVSVEGFSLSGVYSIENGILLRLRHSTKPEKLIALSSFAAWLTTKNLALPEASSFASRIRSYIEREKIISVEQVGSERIARFTLEGRSGAKHNLYAEFFAGGNQIIADASDDDKILDLAKAQRFRHRVLIPGEKYQLPPSRGIPLSKVTLEILHDLVNGEKIAGNISIIRWFGRNVGTSRKFIEEIFHIAGLDPGLQISSVGERELEILAASCRQLLQEIEHTDKGYLLIPREDSSEAQTTSKISESLEVDACAIVTHAWKVLEQENLVKVLSFSSFSEALDEAQVQSLIYSRRKKASVEARSKAAELESALKKQDVLVEKNQRRSSELRSISTEIMSGRWSDITTDLLHKLEELGVIDPDQASGGKFRFSSEPKAFLSSFSARSLASRLFDEAKRLEDANHKIKGIRAELLSQKGQLEEQTILQEDRVERKLSIERRPREWFERYRWFIASDGRLVVGGRDSTTNSVIINKYTNSSDLVFHADLHGSPFFVLKNEDPSQTLNDELALEIAQATVGFSRAWKDELASADAFWVRADQVKKSAPSGEYLPRGSFFIEGRKNFVKHVKVELALGVMSTTNLPNDRGHMSSNDEQEDDSHDALPTDLNVKNENVLVVCGPEKSISKYSIARVKISPGKEKASSIAKRIKQVIIAKVKDPALKEMTKRLTVDEIIRVLPSGNYKLISEKQNN
ncbi:MAG: NFACT RNA binding domain-containing protein [Nitrososphaerales archaeon]